jgi:hypothetical protein
MILGVGLQIFVASVIIKIGAEIYSVVWSELPLVLQNGPSQERQMEWTTLTCGNSKSQKGHGLKTNLMSSTRSISGSPSIHLTGSSGEKLNLGRSTEGRKK